MKSLLNKKTQKLMRPTIFLTICLILAELLFASKFCVFLIGSASMEPDYPVRCLVVVERQPFESLSIGDVVAFKSTALSGGLAFHRITRFVENGFYVKGDKNEFEDNQRVSEEDYVGKCVLRFYSAGVYISAIQTTKGFIIFVALPLTVIFLLCFLIKKTWHLLKQ